MTQWLKNLVTFFFGTVPGSSSSVNNQITDSVTTKKPVANKAVKKPAKPATKKTKK